MLERSGRERRTSIGISSLDAGSCRSPAGVPLNPVCNVRRDIRRGNALQGGLVEIDFDIVLGLRIFHIPVDVHHSRRLLENLFDLGREFGLALVVRTIDFRYESFENGRTRGNLSDLDSRAKRSGNLVEFRTKPARDVVALRAAILAREQVDLYVGLIRLAPQEIMTHEAVEIVRAGCSRIDLIVE